MKSKKITAVLTAFITSLSASVPLYSHAQTISASDYPTAVVADQTGTKHSVNFVDFDGNTIHSMLVAENEEIDYSLVNTDSLKKHIDTFTEIEFYKWDTDTKFTSKDLTVHALYRKAVISFQSSPTKTVYTSKDGNVDLTGLSAYITVYTQTRTPDEDGLEYFDTEKTDISSTCYASPSTLEDAFSDGNTAEITVYPIGDTKPLTTYTISLTESTSVQTTTTATTASSTASETVSTTTANPPATEHTVTFLDFDGNVFKTIKVKEGEKIDYSSIDTSALESHPDIYTQIGFSSWSTQPETVSSDTTVKALWKKMILTVEGSPEKTEYSSADTKIDLSGLYVNITVFTQTPVLNSNNEYFVTNSTLDITSSCYTSPATPAEAFADGDSAEITVYPLGDEKPLIRYNISLASLVGDANGDGSVNSVDASAVMSYYSKISVNEPIEITPQMFKIYDVNSDGSINSIDASLISAYYTIASATHKIPDWSEVLPSENTQ